MARVFGELGKIVAPSLAEVSVPSRKRADRGKAKTIRKSTDVQQRIERSAISLVARRGYFDVLMATIAGDAGMSLSTLYRHFRTKDAALEAAFFRAALEIQATSLPTQRYAADWALGVGNALAETITYLEADPDLTTVFAEEIWRVEDRARAGCRTLVGIGEEILREATGSAGGQASLEEEALLASLYCLFGGQIKACGTTWLATLAPLATYLLSAPALGPAGAARAASQRH